MAAKKTAKKAKKTAKKHYVCYGETRHGCGGGAKVRDKAKKGKKGRK